MVLEKEMGRHMLDGGERQPLESAPNGQNKPAYEIES